MIYSVWDQAERRYNYYRTPEKDRATHAPKPAHLRSNTLGAIPEETAWPLPPSARLVGTGKYPKGNIASQKSGLYGLGFFGLHDLLGDPTKLLLVGAVGFFAWQYVKRR